MNRKLRKLINNPRKFFLDSNAKWVSVLQIKKIINRYTPVEDIDDIDDVKPLPAQPEVCPLTLSVPGYEIFDLYGDNWSASPDKPVAILWGFNVWKRDFVARYLPEYRVAFVRGNTPWSRLELALNALDYLRFIVWGYNESEEMKVYAAHREIPISRMEDGFLRSASLGSQHSTALSLALDHSGLYFDATKPSDLEQILNRHDFSSDKSLMHAVEPLMKLHRELKLSKYALGSFVSVFDILGVKIKRRILVLGQVADDASIRYGLAEGWTSEKLIELARTEHPHAEIIYRPHPDVLKGFRSHSAELDNLKKICRVLTEEVALVDLFEVVDQVYTITSLSGMEALIHGLPVTVVGVPFYAGWGLTDDRMEVPRRSRTLTLPELFCAAYLLYPRYLADLEDPIKGCLATMLRMTGERQRMLTNQLSVKQFNKHAARLAKSDYWPILFKKEFFPSLVSMHGKKLLTVISLGQIYSQCHGEYYQRAISSFIVGQLKSNVNFSKALNEIRLNVRPNVFSKLLTELWEIAPSPNILKQWAFLSEGVEDYFEADRALHHLAFSDDFKKRSGSKSFLAQKQFAHVLALAQFKVKNKQFDEAADLFNDLLLAGHVQAEVFTGLAEIARMRFDFLSAEALLNCLNVYEPSWRTGSAYPARAQSAALAHKPKAAIEAITLACLWNPQYVEIVDSISDVLDSYFGHNLPYAGAMQAAIELSEEGNPISRAKGLIAHERADEAECVLLAYTPTATEMLKYCLMLSLAYSCQGKMEEAKNLINNILPQFPSVLVYREALRVCICKNDYLWGKSLLDATEIKGLDVGDMYYRKVLLGLGDIKGSYLTFRKMKANKILMKYCEGKYLQSANSILVDEPLSLAILAVFGPGDEIRFAGLYREIRALFSLNTKVTFTCDPRLQRLLERNYSELEFKPAARIRSLAWLDQYDKYNQLPGSELHTFFDNEGWKLCQSAEKVVLVTDLLGDVITGYESFKGTPYLKADPLQVSAWKTRLQSCAGNEKLVGLSWRSSLTTYSRNEHYLAVEELAPLFEIPNVKFVNLQYDKCTDELAWLENNFPGRVLDFPDLDQFNDLDGVAALMSNLDLVIAPATTVVELAGALGCSTLLISNSSELHWRKSPEMLTDTWHQSVLHVEGEVLGDKASVVRELVSKLKEKVG